MVARNIQLTFFLGTFTLVAVLGFFILKPYVNILILAVTFAVIFRPFYKKLAGKKRSHFNDALAAIMTIAVILVIVLLPLGFLGTQVFNEAQSVYTNLREANEEERSVLDNIPESSNPTIAKLQERARAALTEFGNDPAQILGEASGLVTSNLGPFFKSVAGTLLAIFLWLFSLFYFLKDGGRVQRLLVAASPLEDKYDNEIIDRLARAVKSVVGGTLVVALLQGILTGIGFWIFGVPLPAIWGSVAVITALIPTVGTAVVNVPAIVYLFFTGHPVAAVIMLIWAFGVVGTVDNFLRPFLLERGIQIHPLIILLSVLGGISLFGPIGFITGPLVMALLSELTNIYRQLVLKQKAQG